eukprot:5238626-Alexandrium_andersonii.AAC.1
MSAANAPLLAFGGKKPWSLRRAAATAAQYKPTTGASPSRTAFSTALVPRSAGLESPRMGSTSRT